MSTTPEQGHEATYWFHQHDTAHLLRDQADLLDTLRKAWKGKSEIVLFREGPEQVINGEGIISPKLERAYNSSKTSEDFMAALMPNSTSAYVSRVQNTVNQIKTLWEKYGMAIRFNYFNDEETNKVFWRWVDHFYSFARVLFELKCEFPEIAIWYERAIKCDRPNPLHLKDLWSVQEDVMADIYFVVGGPF